MSRRAGQVLRSLAEAVEADVQRSLLLLWVAADLGLIEVPDEDGDDLDAEEQAEAMADEIAEALRALAQEVAP